MWRALLPKSDDFFDFFERHAEMVVAAAKGLLDFANEGPHPEEVFGKIKACEQEADRIAHKCIEKLHKTFITPLERTDIHTLISTLDDVIDEIEDVGKFLVLYKLGSLRPGALKLMKIIVEATQEVQAALHEFRKLKHTDALQSHFFNISHLENQADEILLEALRDLFNDSKAGDALEIMKWKEIYEHLEHAIDACEDVGNILEGIVLEHE